MQPYTSYCICPVCYRQWEFETEFHASGTTADFNGKSLSVRSCGEHTQQEVKAAYSNRNWLAGYTPQVGDFATLSYPTDRYPYVVTSVSPAGKKVVLEALSTNGLEPFGQCNGFPVFDHRYTLEDVATRKTGRVEAAYRQGDGSYQIGGSPVYFGEARYYRNYAD